MKNCYGYTRVSTVKQGEGVSLQEQRDAILAFANKNEMTIVEWFEEKETAAKSGRPVFNRMVRLLRKGKAQGLIMHKIDRSARNLKDWSIVSELPDEGISVYIVTESIDFTTRGGRLTADMLAVIAADYIRNLREETKKGIQGRLKQGLYPRQAPLGYLDNGPGKPKTPCPEKGPLIRELFECYASGEYSLRSLREEITRRGLRNKNGRPLNVSSIAIITDNPFYTGLIAVKKTGETYHGIHEPIISASLFRQVQAIKTGRYRPKVTKRNHRYRGLFRCGLCGSTMTPEKHKQYVYYRCQTASCATTTVREDILDLSIGATLQQCQITPEAAERLTEDWGSGIPDLCTTNQRKRLDLGIRAVEEQLTRASDLLVEGILDGKTYLTKKQNLSMRLLELQEERRSLHDQQAILSNSTKYLSLIQNLSNFFDVLQSDEKRMFIKNTFLNRTVIGRKPYFTTHNWVRTQENTPSVQSGPPDRAMERINQVPEEIYLLFERYFGKPTKE